MNILIDIGHPAHVHLFRNLYRELVRNGHDVTVTVKNLESAKSLLRIYDIPYIELGSKKDSIGGKFIGQISFLKQLLAIRRKHKIQFAIGSSLTITHLSLISNIKSFLFDDDDSAVEPLMARFGHPFASYIISPDVLDYERKKKHHITYPGYHELSYLHPNRFQPDPNILDELGIDQKEPFFVMRFNAFKAHHDIGVQGLSIENKKKLVELLSSKGRVYITTERNIDTEFMQYQLKVSPEKAHTLLYYAKMFIGDSQTMTSEAAVLGTPAIRSNSFVGRISYLEQEEKKYNLTYGFLPDHSEQMFSKIEELLAMPNLKEIWQQRRQALLNDKIDVTSFFVWFFENYPASVQEVKKNPTIFRKFQ